MEKIVKLQLALFYENPLSRPDKLMGRINADMGNLFDAMPQILPIPMDAPLEIPRVQMRSDHGKYNCNIASSRVDFILGGNPKDEASWPEVTEDFLAKARLFIGSVFGATKIIRFGIIGNFFIPDKAASTLLTQKYLKADLSSAEEINIRYNKRLSSHGLDLNNITSVNSVMAETNGVLERGVFIELDVNNVPTGTVLAAEILLQIIEEQMPSFSPEKVNGLVK